MSKVNMRELANLVNNNYGSIYNTSGGGKVQFGGVNVKKFLKDILGNRVFDVYLKYLGIKTLTTASLVPFGLIYGKQFAEKMMNQSGGSLIPSSMPFVDHPLIGNYLKLAGISTVSLTSSTLIPLGILIVAYELYNSEQVGGRIVLPSEYFNPKNKQRGGARTIFGNSIPPSPIQNIDNIVRGQESIFKPVDNSNLACSTGNCSNNVYSSHFKPEFTKIDVPGFPEYGMKDHTIFQAWSGTPEQAQFTPLPAPMAGGALEPNELRFNRHPVNSVPTSQYGGYRKNELSEYYDNMMKNDRKQVVNKLVSKWNKMENLSQEHAKSIKKMSKDKRYSNKTIIKLFPKNILVEGLY